LLFYTEIQNLKTRKKTREEDEYEDGVSSRVCNKQSLRERERKQCWCCEIALAVVFGDEILKTKKGRGRGRKRRKNATRRTKE
jgi:hypothetical protein